MFKREIKRKGLVSSGKLINSINWGYINNTFKMNSVDYFKYLVEKCILIIYQCLI
jgi:hypothetical protein